MFVFDLFNHFFKQKIEEHHLYSIGYLHVGSPKIWYSVPERYSFKFETLMKKYFPDLLGKPSKLHGVVSNKGIIFVCSRGIK